MTAGPLPSSASGLASFADATGGQHVFYVDTNNNVNQLFFDGTKWIPQNLTKMTAGPLSSSAGGLSSFADAIGGQHLFYVDTNNNVNQLFFNGTKWIEQNLGSDLGAPKAASASGLTSFADATSGQHLFYVDTNNNVNQLFFNGTKWIEQDLGSDLGAPKAASASGLTSFADATGGQHLFYVDTNNNVNQLFFNGTKWIEQNLGSDLGAPKAASAIRLTGFADARSGQHVFYIGANNGVNQLFFNGTRWFQQVLANAAGTPSGSSGGGAGGGSGPNQPSLIANYCFDNSVGVEPFILTVTFAGTTAAGPGSGATTFNQATTKAVSPSHAERVCRGEGWQLEKWSLDRHRDSKRPRCSFEMPCCSPRHYRAGCIRPWFSLPIEILILRIIL